MQNNRNFLIAMILSIGVLVGWQFLVVSPRMEAQRLENEAAQSNVAQNDGSLECIECERWHAAYWITVTAVILGFGGYLHISMVGNAGKVKVLFYYVQIVSLSIPSVYLNPAFNIFNFRSARACGTACANIASLLTFARPTIVQQHLDSLAAFALRQ